MSPRRIIIVLGLVFSILQVSTGLDMYYTKNYSMISLHATIGTILGIVIIAGLILSLSNRLLRSHLILALILILIQASIYINVISNIDPWYFLGASKIIVHLILGFLILFIMIGATTVEFVYKKK